MFHVPNILSVTTLGRLSRGAWHKGDSLQAGKEKNMRLFVASVTPGKKGLDAYRVLRPGVFFIMGDTKNVSAVCSHEVIYLNRAGFSELEF